MLISNQQVFFLMMSLSLMLTLDNSKQTIIIFSCKFLLKLPLLDTGLISLILVTLS